MEAPIDPDRSARQPTEAGDRLPTLYAEAKSAIAYATNQMRMTTELFREAHRIGLRAWQHDRDELEALDTRASRRDAAGPRPADAGAPAEADAAAAAESAADEAVRQDLRRSVDIRASGLADEQRDLSRLELVTRGLESARLFLERDDASLVLDDAMPISTADLRMRVVEAQERERVRLAQEIHDGPAQMIANAFFQVDYVERLMEHDPRLARTELRFLREVMRRELADIRSFIGQLRPPALDEIGLDGAIREAVDTFAASVEVRVELRLDAPSDGLTESQQLVVLRVLQEALQNIRKHAVARTATVSTAMVDGAWTLEVRDDGRGFDIDAVGARGRHNFGLEFMRERAELIGGDVMVRSAPAAGTTVRLTIRGEGQPG